MTKHDHIASYAKTSAM